MKNGFLIRERVKDSTRSRGATPSPVMARSQFLPEVTQQLARLPWLQLGVGLAIALIAGMLPWAAGRLLSAVDPQITHIQVTGHFRGLNKSSLEKSLTPFLDRSFFATNLSDVKRYVESQPWVANAAVKRVWPDGLTVDVVEQKPVAYWNAQALVNGQGQVFRPANPKAAGDLPHLTGPAGHAQEVLQMASSMSKALAPLGLGLADLDLAPRGAWTLDLNDGVRVVLGTDDVQQRFQRFLNVYQQALSQRMDQVQQVDARYSNGVAVQWKQNKGNGATGKQG